MKFYCFQEHKNRPQLYNYLSFGPSRKTMEYSNHGNDPVVVKKTAIAEQQTAVVAARDMLIKPNAACSII